MTQITKESGSGNGVGDGGEGRNVKGADSDDGAKGELYAHIDVIFGTIRTVVVGFSLLFAIVAGGLGFFGWRTMLDIGATIDNTVDSRVGRLIDGASDENASLSASIVEVIGQVDSTRTRVERLLGDIESAEQALQIVNAGQTDPVGDYLRILDEDAVDHLDVEQRRRAETIFQRLIEQSQSEEEGVSDEILFNAAATASEFNMTALGARLADAAYETNPDSVREARMLRFKLRTNEIKAEEAYEHMHRLSQNAPRHQIHLTLSELFNIAVVSGRFEEFTQMLDDMKTRLGDGAISYIWLLQAQVLLIDGSWDDVTRAISEIRHGLERLRGESPSAMWYDDSIQQAGLVVGVVARHPAHEDTVSNILEEHSWLGGQALRALLASMDEPGSGDGR